MTVIYKCDKCEKIMEDYKESAKISVDIWLNTSVHGNNSAAFWIPESYTINLCRECLYNLELNIKSWIKK